MGFKCGIVGLPNVGKSTLFNALTKAGIQAENYPFCTIDPNVGMVTVPDPRVDQIQALVNAKKVIHAVMEFVDIAGLVAGASKGEGLGNQFLAHIRETDAIAHVVRCFEDDDVVHVAGKVDPLEDIEVINTELLLADLETVEKSCQRVAKQSKTGDKEAQAYQKVLEALKAHLDEGRTARAFDVDENYQKKIQTLHLITRKPVVYVANVDENSLDGNALVDRVKAYAAEEGAECLHLCGALEAELSELSDEDAQSFLEELGLQEPGLNRMIRTGYALLGLETYFTAGPNELRAWTYRRGALAPQAAGVIHTDFEKGFIRAEVVAFSDFIEHQGEQGAKEAGKWRLEGKEYSVVDGDIMHFRFNN